MKIAVIYVNPVEYHGPHLPLLTDFEISKGLTRELVARLKSDFAEIEVVRTVEIHRGCDPAHGPGSEYTSVKELKRLVLEASRALLKEMRPDFVLFMTFHGTPKQAAAIQAGIDFFEANGIRAYNPFNFILKMLRDYDPSLAQPMMHLIPDEKFRAHYLKHLPQDFHAGLFESSVLMKLDPSQVKVLHRDLPDCEDRKLSMGWKLAIGLTRTLGLKDLSADLALGADAIGWAKLKDYNGYTGAPRFASAEIGRYFVDVILNEYAQGFRKMVKENQKSPKPILQWTIHF